MRTTLLKSALVAMAFGFVATASPAELAPVSGIITGLSADGSKAVGVKGMYDPDFYNSYLYDVKSKTLEWLTNYDPSDFLSGGRMVGVTSDGVIAGTTHNPDMRLPNEEGGGGFRPSENGVMAIDEEEHLGAPILSAAVWRNGKVTILGTGYHKIDEFDQETDGTEAIGITEDGLTVFGNIIKSMYQVIPCKWVYDPETDSYEYSELTLGPGVARGVVTCVASNGNVGGFVRHNNIDKPVVWTAKGELIPIEIPGNDAEDYYWGVNADAISANGRYVVVHGLGAHNFLGIYDVETGELTEISLPSGTFESKGCAVTNNGDAYCEITPSTNYTPVLHFYSKSDGILMDFGYYIDQVAPELAGKVKNSNSSVIAVSADGSVITGKSGGQWATDSWVATIDAQETVAVPAPTGVRIFHNSPEELTVTWKGVESFPAGQTFKGYDVYVDGEYTETVSEPDTDGVFRLRVPGENAMTHRAYVVTAVSLDKNGKEYASPNSVESTTYVSTTTYVFGYEDFNNSAINEKGDVIPITDYWTNDVPYGNDAFLIKWHLAIGDDYINRTPYYCTYSIGSEPWSSQLISRFHDATDTKEFFLDFMYKMKLLNVADQLLTTDFLDVEASEDGEHWILVHRLRADEMKPGEWSNAHIDMGEEWSGKNFQIRFNAHGEGNGQLCWQVDNINFADQLEGEVPDGLRVLSANDQKVDFAWHNTQGTHEVSHIYNSAWVFDYNLSNQGKPLMSAVKLTPEMLAPYTGEFITGISTFIFDDPNIEGANPTRAEVRIYDGEGKELLGKGDIYSEFTESDFTYGWLDDAVKIEAGKTYMAAVRIYDYDSRQAPIYYQSVSRFTPGVTDLYSEDDGKSWRKVSQDLNPDATGDNTHCVWPIRALIAPAPIDGESEENSGLMHYVVARDGEVISKENIYLSTPRFVDNSPLASAEYTVRAYYEDGSVSEFSAPLRIDASGIGGVEKEANVSLVQNGDVIVINGEFDSATVIDMTGRRVLSTKSPVIPTAGLPTGAYIINVTADGARSIFKVIVR